MQSRRFGPVEEQADRVDVTFMSLRFSILPPGHHLANSNNSSITWKGAYLIQISSK